MKISLESTHVGQLKPEQAWQSSAWMLPLDPKEVSSGNRGGIYLSSRYSRPISLQKAIFPVSLRKEGGLVILDWVNTEIN